MLKYINQFQLLEINKSIYLLFKNLSDSRHMEVVFVEKEVPDLALEEVLLYWVNTHSLLKKGDLNSLKNMIDMYDNKIYIPYLRISFTSFHCRRSKQFVRIGFWSFRNCVVLIDTML
jgi:hypothetical protein